MKLKIITTGWESLGFKSYKEYLSSDIWKERQIYMIRLYPYCKICNAPKRYSKLMRVKRKTKEGVRIMVWEREYFGKTLQVHHTNYSSCGDEHQEDLQVLCYGCHKNTHEVSGNDI